MATRKGLGISVKMILTTTLLIVVTVVGFGLLSITNIRKAFDETAERQVKVFSEGRTQLSAQPSAFLLPSVHDPGPRRLQLTGQLRGSDGDRGMADEVVEDE